MSDGTDIESCVDDIVATCNGDMRGALKALMLVNEHLERELHRLTAMAGFAAVPALPGSALH